MTSIPKAALYYYPRSIWSAVALLALEEKGYGADEVDLRIVDIWKGENYDPTFLRLNPKATVPTLVVPLSNTLSDEIDSRYKAITESIAIAEFLDKSRSLVSRTHTTSSAPAPALAPATIAATDIARVVIGLLHSEEANPNHLRYKNARDDASLKVLAKEVLHIVQAKRDALKKHLADAEGEVIHVSEKVKKFWQERLESVDLSSRVLEAAEKPVEELSEEEKAERQSFIDVGRKAWEKDLPIILLKLSKETTGPFSLGDQFSIADLHLAPWFTRVVKLAGGSVDDDGKTVVEKLEKYVGAVLALPRDFSGDAGGRGEKQAKLGAFWDALKERPSWQKLYGQGLF
ncbi:hypothetical protein CC1G_12668 [Coprinopsis cinerea okayama7|uniref:GST N-terminal domain-containing protein n=1 Tax=Coprinopsis cinerea (strain Okayama-7 / 130 / ATCC MYA-4618 / FGSC 9003) TaxID=240176 RepID=A8N1E4_COPC7|nr:hypothetical protein CC1G_12668 [Coprinopsis cinerea okayama7\|eukprot:XP_001828693.1 hypothetical protein CC1G_12668 [Coprinopsis cinerea okayama7\